MQPDTLCNVTNRSCGVVTYVIPERHIRREFNVGETKRVPYQEILEVSSQPGGRELIYNYLYVAETEVLTEGLNISPEPEYFLTEDKIDEWMQTCSLNAFKDALDFAPTGIVNLIKAHAVTLPLNDVSKCKALKDQVGFDVMRAIANEKATQEDEEVVPVKRRREPVKEDAQPTRRITPKYNVVKRGDAKEE